LPHHWWPCHRHAHPSPARCHGGCLHGRPSLTRPARSRPRLHMATQGDTSSVPGTQLLTTPSSNEGIKCACKDAQGKSRCPLRRPVVLEAVGCVFDLRDWWTAIQLGTELPLIGPIQKDNEQRSFLNKHGIDRLSTLAPASDKDIFNMMTCGFRSVTH
jgi:hypothetical protein